MNTSKPEWRTLAVGFALGWAAIGWPWLSGAATIPYDAKALFQAQLQFLATALHTGQSPFWNPHVFLGMPQISDPQSLIFSPAALIAAASANPGFQTLDIYVQVLLAIGGLSTAVFCRDNGWGVGGAWVAGLVFAFGGAASWRMQHISQIQSYAFFAVALCTLNRAIARARIRDFVAAGVATGLMLIEPNQVALLGCYALAIIALAKLVPIARARRAPLHKVLRGPLLAAAVAIAISAVPLALTYLFLLQSNRPSVTLAEAAHGSLNPASLLTFLVPDLFGARGDSYWGPYSQSWSPADLTLSQNMGQFYFGAWPAMLFLALGVVRGHLWDRRIRVYSLVLVVALLYSVGTFSPAFAAAYFTLPGVAAFRRPVDALFIAGSMTSILSGYLVHLWLSDELRRVSPWCRSAEVWLLFGIVGFAAFLGWWHSKLHPAAYAAGSAGLWLVLASLFLRAPPVLLKRNLNGFAVAIVVFVTADLSLHNGPNESSGISPDGVADVLTPTSSDYTIGFLKSAMRRGEASPWRDRVEIVGMGFDWQNCASVHRLDSTLGYNPFRLGIVSAAIGARDYNVGPDQRSFAPLFPSYDSMLARLLGLRFVVSSVPIAQIDPEAVNGGLRLIKRTTTGYIYEYDKVLPRALLVEHAVHANFDEILRSGQWPIDFDPEKAVLLGSPSEIRNSSVIDVAPPGSVKILSYQNDEVVLDATLSRDAYLVLHDLWHPWWEAMVDGARVEIFAANVLFRAIKLTKGVHTVTFRFAPISGATQQILRMLKPMASRMAGTHTVLGARF